jgi:excisionase family DNA binding protein
MRQAASLLGICVTSLYRLVLTDGIIPSFCIGTRRLIPYEELLKFCRERTDGAANMPPSQVSNPSARGIAT